ncbi:hypothetical protein [Nonomuraea recticatena]|uniref:hypothetical protein n=1 Tax=Nonomuraea recticatena TaxID=46178 RepID=UPI00361B318F
MALIILAADKGAPGVTTAATALGAVWPRAVLLAECDPAGGDLAYRLPAADGGMLNPGRGLLTLGATARRGLEPAQIHEHTQKIIGGLDVLAGLTHGEQAAGLTWMWGPLGRALSGLPGADVLADCGRLGAHPQVGELIAEAELLVLFTRASLDHVAHLRERLAIVPKGPQLGVVVIADPAPTAPPSTRCAGSWEDRPPSWRGWPTTPRAPSCCAASGAAGSTDPCSSVRPASSQDGSPPR